MRKYVTETVGAPSRPGARTLIALSFVFAAINWSNGGVVTAAAVLLTSLGCGMTVLIIMARASLNPDQRGTP